MVSEKTAIRIASALESIAKDLSSIKYCLVDDYECSISGILADIADYSTVRKCEKLCSKYPCKDLLESYSQCDDIEPKTNVVKLEKEK